MRVKVRERLWSQLNVNKHVVSLFLFRVLNQDHGLSRTLPKSCQCLNTTMKKLQCFGREQMEYIVSEHFTDTVTDISNLFPAEHIGAISYI